MDEKIIYANPMIEDALGYIEGGLAGLSTKKATANFSWPLHLYQRQCVNQWGLADYKMWLVSKKGMLVPAHNSVRRSYEQGEPAYRSFTSLMCPMVREVEHFRPVRYPRLVAVN